EQRGASIVAPPRHFESDIFRRPLSRVLGGLFGGFTVPLVRSGGVGVRVARADREGERGCSEYGSGGRWPPRGQSGGTRHCASSRVRVARQRRGADATGPDAQGDGDFTSLRNVFVKPLSRDVSTAAFQCQR